MGSAFCVSSGETEKTMATFSTGCVNAIPAIQDSLTMKRFRCRKGFSIIELVIVLFILAVLVGLTVPAALRVQLKGAQMKDLNNGKQIYLGLKLFSTDNDGRFPWADYDASIGGPAASGATVSNANTAYQNICPQYIKPRATFYAAKSVWTPNVPDENAATMPLTLPGDNAYAYVPGLNSNSNPSFPLIADAFSNKPGVYSKTRGEKGSIWNGKTALVVRVDGSAKFESCNPGTLKVAASPLQPDLFKPDNDWIPQAPVNPR